jgi:hypothetical protein
MQSRLLLEEREGATEWQSDRQLKSTYFDYFQSRKSRDFCPDGVFKTPDGKLIAFEYEAAQKSKKRYDNKMGQYVYCVRPELRRFRDEMPGPKYDHVRFVCEKPLIAKYLRGSTMFKEIFTIETIEEFLKTRNCNAEAEPIKLNSCR